MPGQVSIQRGEYYAHPQNAFWKIMGELFGAYPHLPYETRLSILAENKIALWESLKSCIRPGSADISITEEIPNDFKAYFKKHRLVKHIFFDGQKAFKSFHRLILPELKEKDLNLICLPSTSPRHAAMSYAQKLRAWQKIKEVM